MLAVVEIERAGLVTVGDLEIADGLGEHLGAGAGVRGEVRADLAVVRVVKQVVLIAD